MEPAAAEDEGRGLWKHAGHDWFDACGASGGCSVFGTTLGDTFKDCWVHRLSGGCCLGHIPNSVKPLGRNRPKVVEGENGNYRTVDTGIGGVEARARASRSAASSGLGASEGRKLSKSE